MCFHPTNLIQFVQNYEFFYMATASRCSLSPLSDHSVQIAKSEISTDLNTTVRTTAPEQGSSAVQGPSAVLSGQLGTVPVNTSWCWHWLVFVFFYMHFNDEKKRCWCVFIAGVSMHVVREPLSLPPTLPCVQTVQQTCLLLSETFCSSNSRRPHEKDSSFSV